MMTQRDTHGALLAMEGETARAKRVDPDMAFTGGDWLDAIKSPTRVALANDLRQLPLYTDSERRPGKPRTDEFGAFTITMRAAKLASHQRASQQPQ